jgi:ClpP class serine protease
MWAILNECAFSGAYAIASAADRITVPRTGGTGSIGVVWMHCDFSGALNDAGIKVTFVKRGARKIDGAPEIPALG